MVTRCSNTYGNNQGVTNEGDHTPVESKEAHSKTSGVSEKLVNNHIVWRNPAHPVENTDNGKQVAGEPEPAETSEDNQAEELLAGDVLGVPLAVVLCNVPNKAAFTSAPDQIMADGQTKN